MTPLGAVTIEASDVDAINEINKRVAGWSGPAQYAFFKGVLAMPEVKKILVLGVYHGRDISYIVDLLRRYHPAKEISVTGVDRFTADPCADWPQVNEARTWEQEVGVAPPSFENAVANTRDPRVSIIKSDDFMFLETTKEKFDLVYLDTAHDFNTVTRQLRQVPRVCNEGAIVCGDDYADGYTWGVKSAVQRALPEKHSVFADWIWVAKASDLPKQ